MYCVSEHRASYQKSFDAHKVRWTGKLQLLFYSIEEKFKLYCQFSAPIQMNFAFFLDL